MGGPHPVPPDSPAKKPWWRRWFGTRSERAAAHFLRNLGYRLLARNYTCKPGEAELVRKLERSVATNTPLRIKYGIDPTGIDVHLGHTVPLRKLRQFQELGHQAVIILGNYTALVGDPSGRDETRAKLTEEQVER